MANRSRAHRVVGAGAGGPGIPAPNGVRIVETIDAKPLIEAGEFPLGRVRAAASRLAPGEAVRVESPFPPVSLVDALRSRGFRCATREVGKERFETLVVKE